MAHQSDAFSRELSAKALQESNEPALNLEHRFTARGPSPRAEIVPLPEERIGLKLIHAPARPLAETDLGNRFGRLHFQAKRVRQRSRGFAGALEWAREDVADGRLGQGFGQQDRLVAPLGIEMNPWKPASDCHPGQIVDGMADEKKVSHVDAGPTISAGLPGQGTKGRFAVPCG